MLFTQIARVAVRQPVTQRQQRRTILNWMTNYPDRINELKKIQNAGGRSIYTWQKQPTDIYVTGFGVTLAAYGIIQLVQGHYRLATGKGKMD